MKILAWVVCGLLLLLSWAKEHPPQIQEALACLDNYISELRPLMEEKLFEMLRLSYPNTLSTTVKDFRLDPGDQATYIITGDIEAMWLRDSTNQFLPYMKIPKDCPHIRQLALGLLNTQAELIMTDPYSNAFKKFEAPGREREWYLNDKTEVLVLGVPVDLSRHREFATRSIWERKFEIDSLASFLRLAHEYRVRYGRTDFLNLRFLKALRRVMRTVDQQTKDSAYERRRGPTFYSFFRSATELKGGHIPLGFATGLVKTGFRPSDDPNDLAFNIPGNAMLATYLLHNAQFLEGVAPSSVLMPMARAVGQRMRVAGERIRKAVMQAGVVEVDGRKVFAYEVDGRGQAKTFDDANLPSLLSLPYLEFVSRSDLVYRNTRELLLSRRNQYFYEGGGVSGIGSSHTPAGNVWPLAVMAEALTSQDESQIRRCLGALKAQSKDNLIHESFSVRNPESITRGWFAWANSLFGELILTLLQSHPSTLK